MSKVWFVTGASKGFGREFVLGALGRGDKVAATARNIDTLADLVDQYGDAVLALRVDVTDREQVFAAVSAAQEEFGRLDVVVNNAGYGLFGTVEEITERQLRDQLETNLFGVLHVTQAVLPILREQGSGHIIQISTIGGVAAFPTLGGYHASKWALEGMTEALAQEVGGFGIKVTLVEPGGFDTDWGSASATVADALPQYAPLHAAMTQRSGAPSPKPVREPQNTPAGSCSTVRRRSSNPAPSPPGSKAHQRPWRSDHHTVQAPEASRRNCAHPRRVHVPRASGPGQGCSTIVNVRPRRLTSSSTSRRARSGIRASHHSVNRRAAASRAPLPAGSTNRRWTPGRPVTSSTLRHNAAASCSTRPSFSRR